MNKDLTQLAKLLRETAASEILPRWHRTRASRKSDGSLVTETDIASQQRLATALARDFPGVPLLGEEMSLDTQSSILSDGTQTFWVLDPLDGTSNYANGFPFFSISLALLERGSPVLGLVLDPVRDECYCASKGGGAYLDDSAIRASTDRLALGDCLAGIDLKRLPPSRLPALFRPGGFQSQRNLGSVALDWCWLAADRFQLYLHGGQKLWDYAAGRLIAEEAGAAARHLSRDGLPIDPAPALEPRLAIAAANEPLLSDWIDFVGLPFAST